MCNFFSNSLAFEYSSDPKDFVGELVNETISKLADKNLTEEEKKNFVEKVALENVDINALSLYTLGELRKSLGSELYSNAKELEKKITQAKKITSFLILKLFNYLNFPNRWWHRN